MTKACNSPPFQGQFEALEKVFFPRAEKSGIQFEETNPLLSESQKRRSQKIQAVAALSFHPRLIWQTD
jgi:hypothetical protein